MPTKKKTTSKTKKRKAGAKTRATARPKTAPPPHAANFDASLKEYGQALDLLRKGDFAKAAPILEKVEAVCRKAGETELADRARTYAVICARRLAPESEPPRSAEDFYYMGVLLANDGRPDDAIRCYDQALQKGPADARTLYARASARALRKEVEASVEDLRRAIEMDPQVRFVAANDPDFENIRDDAAFIDVIEPTPAGA